MTSKSKMAPTLSFSGRKFHADSKYNYIRLSFVFENSVAFLKIYAS